MRPNNSMQRTALRAADAERSPIPKECPMRLASAISFLLLSFVALAPAEELSHSESASDAPQPRNEVQ